MDFEVENKIKLCLICGHCCSEDVKEVLDVTRDKLETLSPGTFIGTRAVICDNCSKNLDTCYALKSSCSNTEHLINSFAGDKGDQIDMKDVFLSKTSNVNVPETDRICRLCTRLAETGSWTYFTDDVRDILEQHLPELNLHVIRDPVICLNCHTSLQDYLWFMGNVNANSEHKITSLWEVDQADVSKDVKVKEETISDQKPRFSININYDSNCVGTRKINIKHEDLNIKSEQQTLDGTHQSIVYQCNDCQFITTDKITLDSHIITHQIASKMTILQCAECDFQTKHKPALKRHSLLHRNASDLIMYRCDNCEYETKYKHVLQVHMLVHQGSATSDAYRCGRCQYQARCKRSLKSHESIHKSESTTMMHRCESCSYLTGRKSLLNRHRRVHQDVSQLTTYKCTVCDCRVKYRHDLKKHMLLHADSKATMYKCEFCEHVTKYKGAIKEHMVVHQSEAEATLYPCEVCDFKTRHKKYLKRHAQTHNVS